MLDKLEGDNDDEQVGIDLIKQVLQEPLRMLATNSGVDAGWVARRVMEEDSSTFGFNAMTNEFGDMVEAGVIEPAKVATAALTNAASVGSMILTTECLVTEHDDAEDSSGGAGAAMGGGMPGGMGGMM